MKTPTLKFYLKPIANQRYSHTVVLRLTFDRNKIEVSTKIKCFTKDWDEAKERICLCKIHTIPSRK